MRTPSRSACGASSSRTAFPPAPGTSICLSPRPSIAAAAPDGHALSLLVEEVFATRLAIACCAVVSIRNEAAARAYEKAGFRWLRIWQDPIDGPCWVMLKERPAPPAR